MRRATEEYNYRKEGRCSLYNAYAYAAAKGATSSYQGFHQGPLFVVASYRAYGTTAHSGAQSVQYASRIQLCVMASVLTEVSYRSPKSIQQQSALHEGPGVFINHKPLTNHTSPHGGSRKRGTMSAAFTSPDVIAALDGVRSSPVNSSLSFQSHNAHAKTWRLETSDLPSLRMHTADREGMCSPAPPT